MNDSLANMLIQSGKRQEFLARALNKLCLFESAILTSKNPLSRLPTVLKTRFNFTMTNQLQHIKPTVLVQIEKPPTASVCVGKGRGRGTSPSYPSTNLSATGK